MDDIEVDGGNYGVLVSSSGSGNMDVTNIDFDGQNIAGVYYVKDLGGEISGSITNGAGAAYQYGPLTTKDKTFTGLTLSGNDIGIETAGSGDFTIRDSTITSTTDNIVITGSAKLTTSKEQSIHRRSTLPVLVALTDSEKSMSNLTLTAAQSVVQTLS